MKAACRLARFLRRGAASVAPPPMAERDHLLLLRVYWGAERRALLALAAQVKRAALRELPPAERQRVRATAEQRLGVLV